MENANQWIEELLRKIGKKSFVCHLYPELINNIDVSIEDIASRHPELKNIQEIPKELDYQKHVLFSRREKREKHF